MIGRRRPRPFTTLGFEFFWTGEFYPSVLTDSDYFVFRLCRITWCLSKTFLYTDRSVKTELIKSFSLEKEKVAKREKRVRFEKDMKKRRLLEEGR